MLPHLDAIYFDIKLMDAAAHKKYCGVSNEKILANFGKLAAHAVKRKIPVLARTPLVPGITDTEENLAAIAGYLVGLSVKKAALLPYNPMWHEKSGKIGAADPLADRLDASTWMSRERIEACRAIFTGRGIDARS